MKIIVSEGQSVLDSTKRIRRGGMEAEVPEDFLERNPGAGRLAEVVVSEVVPEITPSPLATELPIEGVVGRRGNGPLVEKLVAEKPAKAARKPRGRRKKAS